MSALQQAIYRARATPHLPRPLPIKRHKKVIVINDGQADIIERLANRIQELEIQLKHLRERHPFPIEPGMKRYPAVREIAKIVADYFEISFEDIIGRRRGRKACLARHIAVYLAKTLTPCSYPEIGRRLDGRDHTTILASYRRVNSHLLDRSEVIGQIEQLKKIIIEAVSSKQINPVASGESRQ